MNNSTNIQDKQYTLINTDSGKKISEVTLSAIEAANLNYAYALNGVAKKYYAR